MSDSGRKVRLRGSARTNRGQVRENNEDNVEMWTGDDYLLAVVADGMGGAAGGEEASRIAVESVEEGISPNPALTELEDTAAGKRLKEIIRDANRTIMDTATTRPEFKGMGTTLTLALIRGTHVIVAHVGDSRAYAVEGITKRIKQITADHSFVEALVAAGHITAEEAEEHPMKNVLYRALGQTSDLEVDVYTSKLRPGDRLILCSDGLTRHVKPDEIREVCLNHSEPDVITQELIDLTNSRGGEDNVSVVVIILEEDPSALRQSVEDELAPGLPRLDGDEEDPTVKGTSVDDLPTQPGNPAGDSKDFSESDHYAMNYRRRPGERTRDDYATGRSMLDPHSSRENLSDKRPRPEVRSSNDSAFYGLHRPRNT